MRYIIAVLLSLALATPAFARPGFFSHDSGEFPVPESGSTLADLVATMNPGEWKLIPDSDPLTVLLTGEGVGTEYWDIIQAALVANPGLTAGNVEFWGNSSKKVFSAWNSAAYDTVGKRWFFTGGGHTDYGGNEVYEYDFDTLAWTRLIEPEALTVQQTDGNFVPAVGPVSPHTYDGILWNPATGTLWMLGNRIGFKPGGPPLEPEQVAVWEFDPDNPGWTAHPSSVNGAYPSAVYLPSDQMMFVGAHGSSTDLPGFLYSTDGTETVLNSGGAMRAGGAIGNKFRIPDSASPGIAGRIFEAHYDNNNPRMTEYFVNVGTATVTQATTAMPSYGFDFRQAGYAFNPVDEKVYSWPGGREVYVWDPATNDYGELSNASSPTAPPTLDADGVTNLAGIDRVFDKWIYLSEGVFAGMADALQEGIWLWKPPAP